MDEFCFRSILRELDPPAAALLDSPAGPFAARIFTARPTSPELSLAPSHFRVLLLRRLRLPLPLTAAADVARTRYRGSPRSLPPGPECYVPEMLLSSLLPLVSAVKVVLLLQPTSWCGTSMSHPADKMTAASRS